MSSISRKGKKKRTSQESHHILTVYFPKTPLLSSDFQKNLSHNEKQEIIFSGQHTRSTSEKILQCHNASASSAGSSLYSFTLPLNTSGLLLESECPSVNQSKHRVHVIPGLCYNNINLFAIQKPHKSIYFAEIFYGFKMSLLFSITPPTCFVFFFFVFCFSRLSKCLSGGTNETGFPACLGS